MDTVSQNMHNKVFECKLYSQIMVRTTVLRTLNAFQKKKNQFLIFRYTTRPVSSAKRRGEYIYKAQNTLYP
jgi:hypothetical protein